MFPGIQEHQSALLKDIGLDLLSTRRNVHKLTIFFKIINNLVPEYMTQLLPRQVRDISECNLRNISDYRVRIHGLSDIEDPSCHQLPGPGTAWTIIVVV